MPEAGAQPRRPAQGSMRGGQGGAGDAGAGSSGRVDGGVECVGAGGGVHQKDTSEKRLSAHNQKPAPPGNANSEATHHAKGGLFAAKIYLYLPAERPHAR